MGSEVPFYRHIQQTLRVVMFLALASAPAQQQMPGSFHLPNQRAPLHPLWQPHAFRWAQEQVKTRLIKAPGSGLLGPHTSLLPNFSPHQGPKSTGVET